MIKIYESAITPAATVYSALSEDDYQINRAQIMQVRGDSTRGIVCINVCLYMEAADFTTGGYMTMGYIDEEILFPNTHVIVPGVEIFSATTFHNAAGAAFAGTQVLDKISLTIAPDGTLFAWVNTITTPATYSGTDYIIVPFNITYTKIYPVVAI